MVYRSSGLSLIFLLLLFIIGVCDSFFEYGCDNGRCIDDSLTCNGYNPCGDHSDCYNTVTIAGTVVPTESDSDFMICVHSYH